MTGNFLIDYFFLPFITALIGVLVFWSLILKFQDWTNSTKLKRRDYLAGKKLKTKIKKIKERENRWKNA